MEDFINDCLLPMIFGGCYGIAIGIGFWPGRWKDKQIAIMGLLAAIGSAAFVVLLYRYKII